MKLKKLLTINILLMILLFCYSTFIFAQNEKKRKKKPRRKSTPKKVFSTKKQRGYATWYGVEQDSRRTSGGGVFDICNYEATHETYPIGTLVLVRALKTRKSTVVKINHNAVLLGDTVIDLSYATAKALGFSKRKFTKVEIQPIKNDPSEPLDSSKINRYSLSRLEKQIKRKEELQQKQKDIYLKGPEYFDTYFLEDEEIRGNILDKKKENKFKIKKPSKLPKKPRKPFIEPDIIDDDIIFSDETPEYPLTKPKKKLNFPKKSTPPPPYIKRTPKPKIQKKYLPSSIDNNNNEYQFLYGTPRNYTVQVGAFLSKARAKDYREQLMEIFGKKVYIAIKDEFYKVLFGNFRTPLKAENFRNKLKRKKIVSLAPKKLYK